MANGNTAKITKIEGTSKPKFDFAQIAMIAGHDITEEDFQSVPLSNCIMNIDNGKLTIQIDLDQDFGQSASGKSIIVASTGGNMGIPYKNIKVGLNIYKPIPKK